MSDGAAARGARGGDGEPAGPGDAAGAAAAAAGPGPASGAGSGAGPLPGALAAARPPRRRGTWRAPYAFAVLMGVAICLIWGSVYVQLLREYRQTSFDATQKARNTAYGFAENLDRSFEAIDQSLLFLRESYLRDPATFDLVALSRGPVLGRRQVQVAVVDGDGMVRSSSLGPGSGRAELAESELAWMRAAGEDRLLLGPAIRSRVSGRWTVNVLRRMTAPDGARLGAIVATLGVEELMRFTEALDVGQAVMLVVGGDGMVRARMPPLPGAIGQAFGGSEAAAIMAGGEIQGAFHGSGGIDATDRIGSWRRLRGYPLAVVAGIESRDVFAGFRRHRLQFIGAGVLMTLVVIGVGALVQRQHQRLLGSQQALTATLQNISQGIMMVDAEGQVPVLNQRAIALLDLPPDLAQMTPTFRDIVQWQLDNGEFGPPGRVDPAVLRVLDSGDFADQMAQFERTRPNGVVLEVRTEMLPDGGAVRTYTDITERRRNERALAAARDAAEAAGRARGEFLAVMSHEIRTPMNGIIGVAGLLQDMPLGATERHYVRIILESGQHLLQLINDILDFSRLDAGRLELEEQAFDVREVLRDSIELLSAEATAKGLKLALEVADEVPARAVGDSHRLRQVLLNLIGNGIKFTAEGAVRVAVRLVRGEGAAVRLGFAVTDTGIGIAPEALGKLFTEFTQVDSSISRRFGGSGLGLAICRRLVERMGGTISVQSEVGAGSTFQFDVLLTLPRGEGVPRGNAGRPGAVAQDGTGLAAGETAAGMTAAGMTAAGMTAAGVTAAGGPASRVLIAEDNATNRLVATRMLERMGHRVEAVENGREAVEAVQRGGFDLVLMDVMMPEMDGLAATEAIRSLSGPAGRIPIIGLTANAMAADQQRCLAAGMTHFETKPISAAQLGRAIARVLEGAAGARPTGDGVPAFPDAAVTPAITAPRREPARASAALDVARLEALVAEIGGASAADVVRQFQADALRQLEDMRDLAQAGRMDLLGHQARLMARAARTVGLVPLGLAATAIQEEVAAGRYDGVAAQVDALEPLVLSGLDALRRWPIPA
ncbi:MAG: PAS-domain containing protein [Acetobacteraceae bacterium]|nr:PAS-domain containing protein [Acetobacteraceae bacterium]